MSRVKFSRVISVSSESPEHPASNLLKDVNLKHTWRCKDTNESRAIVILELEESAVIQGIEVGNDNSFLIEIFVGKSATPDVYKPLLVSHAFMTVQEAKNDENVNSIRFFQIQDLCSDIMNQSWDRIKIICTQTIKKNVHFGLSFIKLLKKEEEKRESLAIKSVKNKNASKLQEDDEETLKKKHMPRILQNIKAAIIENRNGGKLLKMPDSLKRKGKRSFKPDLSDLTDEGPPDSRRSSQGPLFYISEPEDEVLTKNSPGTASSIAERSGPKNPLPDLLNGKREKIPPKKAFDRLLEGVVFVLSGFQNPYRAELRSKAMGMGAKYKGDWDSTCTHLICAFPNTPKYHQVRGKGFIVKKSWIEDCYSQRKKLSGEKHVLVTGDKFDAEEFWVDGCDPADATQNIDGLEKSEALVPIFAKALFLVDSSLPQKNEIERYIKCHDGNLAEGPSSAKYIVCTPYTKSKYQEENPDAVLLYQCWVWDCHDEGKLLPTAKYEL